MPYETELEKFCTWLLRQHGSSDTGSDNTGTSIMTENQGQSGNPWFIPKTWFIPGSWNMIGITRAITVPLGTRLFIVAATSHATYDELPAGTPKTPRQLLKQANMISKSWLHAAVAGGPVAGPLRKLPLKTARTVFDVDIHAGNNYAGINRVSGTGIKMACVGLVNMFPLKKRGLQRITIAGQAPKVGIGMNGEEEYNMHVTYEVTVS